MSQTAARKVALVFVGTSKYADFFPMWYEGVERYLFNEPDCEKVVYAYTDRISEEYFNKENVQIVQVPHAPWPWVTLNRFAYIHATIQDMMDRGVSHLLFLDADLFPQTSVNFSQVFSETKTLTGVCHPGNMSNPNWHAFVTNPGSTACVHNIKDFTPQELSSVTYHQGCLWGGSINSIKEMCSNLVENIKTDTANSQMANWHDESHMNFWFLKNYDDVHTLPSSFAFPDQKFWHQELPKHGLSPVMLHIDKPHTEYPRFEGAKPDESDEFLLKVKRVLEETQIKWPFVCEACGFKEPSQTLNSQVLQEWFFVPRSGFSKELISKNNWAEGKTHAAVCEKCTNKSNSLVKVY